MCPRPVTIFGMDTVREALRVMTDHQIRHLVVTAPSGAICGLISQRDILRSLAVDSLGTALIHDVMSVPVTHVTSDASVAEAARLMWKKRIGCLPILSLSNALVGIVTRSDVLRYLGTSCLKVWTDG
jgi:CBS domain-containing protein